MRRSEKNLRQYKKESSGKRELLNKKSRLPEDEMVAVLDEGGSKIPATEDLTCPDIFEPVGFRDNGSSHLRSSDEASEVYGRADRSNIARGG